jgi:hypothetical protein
VLSIESTCWVTILIHIFSFKNPYSAQETRRIFIKFYIEGRVLFISRLGGCHRSSNLEKSEGVALEQSSWSPFIECVHNVACHTWAIALLYIATLKWQIPACGMYFTQSLKRYWAPICHGNWHLSVPSCPWPVISYRGLFVSRGMYSLYLSEWNDGQMERWREVKRELQLLCLSSYIKSCACTPYRTLHRPPECLLPLGWTECSRPSKMLTKPLETRYSSEQI